MLEQPNNLDFRELPVNDQQAIIHNLFGAKSTLTAIVDKQFAKEPMVRFYDHYYLDKLMRATKAASEQICPILEKRELNKQTFWMKIFGIDTPKQKAIRELSRRLNHANNYIAQSRETDPYWSEYRDLYNRAIDIGQKTLNQLQKSRD